MPVNEPILDTLAISSLTTIPSASSHAFGLSFANQTSHQGAMNTLSAACVGSTVKRLVDLDVNEAAGIVPIVQQLMKGAQGTPPPTGLPE